MKDWVPRKVMSMQRELVEGMAPDAKVGWLDERYRYHAERIAELRERAAHSVDFIDEQMMTISAGAIAVSMTFLGLFIRPITGQWFILFSWGCFLGTIIMAFVSHHLVLRDTASLSARWRNWFYDNEEHLPGSGPLAPVNAAIMILAKITFSFGLLFMAIFIGINFI